MLGKTTAAIIVLLLAASPCAAFSISPADGWLWDIEVALDDLRVAMNPSLANEIAAERIAEAEQMIDAGDVICAQQAMNHVPHDVVKTAISFTPILAELEADEIAVWQQLQGSYGICNTPTEFTVPEHLKRTPDGEYVFNVTTTSGIPLGSHTVLKLGDVAYVASSPPSGEYGKVRFCWTYTVPEVVGFVEMYEEMF